MAERAISEKEFAEVIRQHSTIINKISYFYSTDKMPFDDIRQEIHINIWRSLPRFRGDSQMSTWIYRICVNSALMALRTSKQKVETVSIDFNTLNLSTELDDEQKENMQELYALIHRLEHLEKAVILLWLDDYSYEEIAHTLGLKKNTVGVMIHRIKEKLSKSF